jgi:DNA-directed RNA polymerase specialized sigma24 family protein
MLMSARGVMRRMKSMMEFSLFTQRAAIEVTDSAAAVSRALAALTEADLLRLQALAHLRARGLPRGISWADLLHEALVRSLDGSRQWPPGVPLLVFLVGVMRSICDETWRRHRREVTLIAFEQDVAAECEKIACPAPDPERVLAATEATAAIYRLFADDETALLIISGLANGMSADDIRSVHALSSLAYDSARRRIRRALLRAGLSWETP